MKKKFYTHYERPQKDFREDPKKGTKTEQGYIKPRVQIKNMMLAGERLAISRRGYDFENPSEVD